MAKVTLKTLADMKQSGEKFTSLTAYDATLAHLVSTQGVEVILVGDSLGNVIQGKSSTVPVTVDDMCYHTRCVAQAAHDAMIMVDLPFASYATEEQALINASRVMQAGAEIVKIEGEGWLPPIVTRLKQQGIPVCVHMGLTPQFVNVFGGYKVQGREEEKANSMIKAALDLQAAGADLLLLECVPSDLAREITHAVKIPVIGIGAGNSTDGQVLVIHDMLNLTPGRKPKFVKNFMENSASPQEAVAQYVTEVKDSSFPGQEHSFD
ncbi:3-methyl-2-oxobutanoate hydroxymethyltransferase [Endozoicomonas numazuensis]|uniref:3-methyl-2-oxobutanoate hydroxymethyltransferase n=1 Tax=Endozoicomonas numazuensis TaxID=1137799 RepID=A0A081NDE1_9GAMM|nr:3-methyl-2-oxobutanoate hydroxymethyltransferase [Endozoicomonas numazuensis]KEQ16464.1 3-methyl-2-oxobutanoate hydroxymethyltransferase [Endozoicomonas numazuensis]